MMQTALNLPTGHPAAIEAIARAINSDFEAASMYLFSQAVAQPRATKRDDGSEGPLRHLLIAFGLPAEVADRVLARVDELHAQDIEADLCEDENLDNLDAVAEVFDELCTAAAARGVNIESATLRHTGLMP